MVVPTETDSPKVAKRLLKTAEACLYLSLHRHQLAEYVRRGQIKAIRRPGLRTAWLFDIRELDRWIEQHSVTRPTPRY